MYISLYVDVNTFIGGRQPQNKLMRLRTFKKNPIVHQMHIFIKFVVFFDFSNQEVPTQKKAARRSGS